MTLKGSRTVATGGVEKRTSRHRALHRPTHKTDRIERERVDVYKVDPTPDTTFIERMVQHVFPKGFKRIRYYGVQATKTFEKVKGLIQEALAKVKGIVKDAIKIIPALTYRQRYEQSLGCDPLICKHCQHEMGLWKIWHPKYGVVYDELAKICKGRYRSARQRALF